MPIKRVDYCIYWTRVKEVPRQSVEITGSDAGNDASRGVKSYIVNSSSIPVAASQSTGIATTMWQVG